MQKVYLKYFENTIQNNVYGVTLLVADPPPETQPPHKGYHGQTV